MKYRLKITVSAGLGVLLLVALIVPVLAKKPLVGKMDLTFNLGQPGPQPYIPDWVGTITIDGEIYGMLFFAIGSGKSFDDFLKGQVHFFEEIWAIYDMGELEEGDWPWPDLPNPVPPAPIPTDPVPPWDYWLPENEPDELVMWGYDVGLTNVQNSKYHMNGDVQFATGEFSEWKGRNVHMMGIIEWQILETPDGPVAAPQFAPGTFRIN